MGVREEIIKKGRSQTELQTTNGSGPGPTAGTKTTRTQEEVLMPEGPRPGAPEIQRPPAGLQTVQTLEEDGLDFGLLVLVLVKTSRSRLKRDMKRSERVHLGPQEDVSRLKCRPGL
ncbi:Hypothetical predicted protein [Xyrichtys novacula]|uniref:Uncharacterized protein n=1 Tax=Xyrichtys novacula TaxID=13765 RepID=A0AAV1H799_XYRNO|nr:Hypothetical predicted protein [Xyrichtys novacula]